GLEGLGEELTQQLALGEVERRHPDRIAGAHLELGRRRGHLLVAPGERDAHEQQAQRRGAPSHTSAGHRHLSRICRRREWGEMTETLEVPAPQQSGRVRRPSGEPPPLPRHLEPIDRVWLTVGGVVILVWVIVGATADGFGSDLAYLDRRLMEPLLSLRTPWLTSFARDVEDLASPWSIHILRWTMFAALVVFRRFRHLIVLLVAMATVAFVA